MASGLRDGSPQRRRRSGAALDEESTLGSALTVRGHTKILFSASRTYII